MEYSAEESAVMLAVVIGIIVVILLPLLIATIFYLISMQKAIGRCREENRAIKPGLVWLYLIPLFGIVWQFFVVIYVSDSLKKEFASLGQNLGDENPGKGVGLAYCIMGVASNVPYIGILPGIGSLVCWIIHWVKIADYSGRLEALKNEQPILLD